MSNTPGPTGALFEKLRLPGVDGSKGIEDLAGEKLVETMVQRALDRYCASNPDASIAVLLDGPYGVPVLRP